MAGDYIFVEVDLCQQRKVLAIGRRCGWNAFETVGHLIDFWSWLTAQPVEEVDGGKTGVLVDIDVDALVDARVAPREMLNALILANWLKPGEHQGAPALLIPDWNSWLSRSAKARRSKGIRQREWRARQSRVDGGVDGRVDADVGASVDGADNKGEGRGKKKEGRGKKSEGKGSAASAAVGVVFHHYQQLHPTARPGQKERRLVEARLREGYSADQLCSAIDGCHKTPHNLGANERNTRYLSLGLIMRDSDHVAGFIENDENPPQARSEKEQRTLDAAHSWLEGGLPDEE
jgi:hypothetical protein